VIGRCQPRHRHQEFLRFLERIDQSIDAELDCPSGAGQLWNPQAPGSEELARGKARYYIHFTPTGSSWLNQIERWFAETTRNKIRRGTFRSVRELTKSIHEYIRIYNNNPRPFQWVASASRIIHKVNKYRNALETAGSSSLRD
jgi:transposase